MTRAEVKALSEAYVAAANRTQVHLDLLSFAVGQFSGLHLRDDVSVTIAPEDDERLRDVIPEQLRQLRLAVDDVDTAIAEHLFAGAAAVPRCPITEVRPPALGGMVRCTKAAGHGTDHDFPPARA